MHWRAMREKNLGVPGQSPGPSLPAFEASTGREAGNPSFTANG